MTLHDFEARLADLVSEAIEAGLATDKIASELEVVVFRLNEGDYA